MLTDTPRSILTAASRFFSGTLLSRFSGLIRDIAMAYAFGATSSVAALLVAYRLAHLFRRLLGEGAMHTAFTPHFEELYHDDPVRGVAFFRDLKLSLGVVLLLVAGMGMGGAAAFLGMDLLDPENREIAALLYILMPSLVFICLFGLNASLLQCRGRFFVSSSAPVAFNMVWALAALAFAELPSGEAMPWVAGGIVIACAAQWLFTLPAVWDVVKVHPAYWKARLFSPDVKAILAPFLLAVAGVAATQVNNALDALFGRYASLEGPAYLWYALRLELAPLSLFGVALSSALFPPLARAVKQHDRDKALGLLSTAMGWLVKLLTPATFFLLAAGPHLVNLVFGHGDFDHEALVNTTYCLWGYSLGLRPAAAILLAAPLFFAMKDYRTPTIASTAAVVANIALNTLFVVGAGFGVVSIAIATSVSSVLNLWVLNYAFQDVMGTGMLSDQVKKEGRSILLASIACVAASWGGEWLIWHDVAAIQLLSGSEVALPKAFWAQLGKLVPVSAPFALLALLTLYSKDRKDEVNK